MIFNFYPYMMKLILDFSKIFYNKRIEYWEPIIEKYSAKITLVKIAWFPRLIFLYNNNDILNINISFSIIFISNCKLSIIKIFRKN